MLHIHLPVGEHVLAHVRFVEGEVAHQHRGDLRVRRIHRRAGAAVQALQQIHDVFVLHGESCAQHVVRIRHDLCCRTIYIGVWGAGGQEHRLALLKPHRVHHEQCERARVSRERLGRANREVECEIVARVFGE